MDFNFVGSVLQVIYLFLDIAGKFAGFSDGHKSFPESVGQGASYDKAAGLDAYYSVKGNLIG